MIVADFRFSFNGGRSNYNGYVKCSLVSQKQNTTYWELFPTFLTFGFYCCFGGPLAHTNLDREYRFDIYDAVGNQIKTYTFKGRGKNQHSLLSSTNWSGTELMAFRSALKKFEIAASKDANFINRKLKEGSERFNTIINKPIGEREMVLADWLNSGEMPTERELDNAIITAPEDFVGWGLRAISNADKGLYTIALADIEEYIKLNPICNIIRPYFLKAALLYKLDRIGDAYEAICVADKYYPQDEVILLMKGSLLSEAGAYNIALSVFEEASRINPNNVETLKTISQLRKICQQLVADRERADIDEANRRAMAMQMLSNATSNAAISISNIVQPNKTNSQSFIANSAAQKSNGNSGESRTKTRTCSMCNGKGWIAGTSTASFDSSTSYYCEDCHREVPSSHSHDICPSCMGKKEITTIR